MAIKQRRKAIFQKLDRWLIWGPIALLILVLAPFITAYLEFVLLGTHNIDDAFRRLGIHDATMRLRDWLVL